MRIAVVASPVTPLRPAQLGGAQAFVCDLALGLVGRGHEVTLHCAAGSEVVGVRLATVPAPADAAAALVMPGGDEPPVAPGVASALMAMFDSIAASSFDVVSQHAFDAPAFELAAAMPVLHTLHLPPIVTAVTRAAATVAPGRLATVSQACLAAWRAAGVDVHAGREDSTRRRPDLARKRRRACDRRRPFRRPAGAGRGCALRSGL